MPTSRYLVIKNCVSFLKLTTYLL